MNNPIISLQRITKQFRSGAADVSVLRGIDLDIYPGEFVAIVGASGSGKSTLLNILGFLDLPTSGRYCFLGEDVAGLSLAKLAYLRNQVAGFIFQQFHLLAGLTALENVALPSLYSSRYDESQARVRLQELGLSHRIDHLPPTLSGGEKQRVSTARALINHPKILFADEPTGSLDTTNEAEVLSILKDLNARGMTIVMVTHEKEIAEQAQRVITMKDGHIVSDQTRHPIVTQVAQAPLNVGTRTIASISLWLYARQAISAMLAKKMRTFLSLLGILIGVLSVVTMMAIGFGAKGAIQQELSHLGANRLLVRPGPAKSGTVMVGEKRSRFVLEDATRLANLPGVRYVCAFRRERCQIAGNGNNWNTDVFGTQLSYVQIRNSVPAVGRFFSSTELDSRERVAVIGQTVATQLFGDADPLGKDITIDKIPFTIIGILPAKGEQGGSDYDDLVVIPITTGMFRLFGGLYVDFFEVEAMSSEAIAPLKSSITDSMYQYYNLPTTDVDFLRIKDMSAIRRSIESTVTAVQLLLSIVAAIALVIGGIGIMNIMLVSVTERTREIGIRKALGATEKDILTQFLIEAVVITGTGGALGIALGMGLSTLIGMLTGWLIVISWQSIAISLGFSIITGIFFGLLPAKQASKLNTVEALRYE